jgi:N-acetylmuramoyl-L-alanine amidase
MQRFFVFIVCILLHLVASGSDFKIQNDYSPKNAKCQVRKSTKFIILHTTEGNDQSSRSTVRERALCNYLVLTNGTVLRIVDKHRISNHAGRSIWNGQRDISSCSIGIEIVGYHDKPPTNAQIRALRTLLGQLMSIYNVPSDRVLTHSMVAYGTPNKYHKYIHRGRKRCAMWYTQKENRKLIGLGPIPSRDPDEKFCKPADKELCDFIYKQKGGSMPKSVGNVIKKDVSAWMIARDQYNHPTTLYTFPNGEKRHGHEIKDWSSLPIGTKVTLEQGTISEDVNMDLQILGNQTLWSIAGSEYNSCYTILFLPDGRIRTGAELSAEELNRLPKETKVLVGYVYGGRVGKDRTPYSFLKGKWNYPSTFYYHNGALQRGNEITAFHEGTIVVFQR